MLTTINDHLHAEMARGTFVTASVLLFDAQRSIIHYARAGHTPILVNTSEGLRMLAPRGLALGIVPNRDFLRHLEERSMRFEVGDTFILYSDGVSEAMNPERDLFDEERLVATINEMESASPEELCDAIVERVEAFREGAEPNDDVTVVIIRADGLEDRAESADPVLAGVTALS
jgi:sigma-B regulation protein RsbU (phosphoserine phosphatase)